MIIDLLETDLPCGNIREPSHYLNQCWNIVDSNIGNKFQWNLKRNPYIFIQENTFEYVVWQMAAVLSRPQCIKANPHLQNQAAWYGLPVWGQFSRDCFSHVRATKLFEERPRSICILFIIYRYIYIVRLIKTRHGFVRWRHNEHDGVSSHRRLDCLFSPLFRRRSKKASKLRVTGLCDENSPVIGEFPHKWPVTRKMFPFDDVLEVQFEKRQYFKHGAHRGPVGPSGPHDGPMNLVIGVMHVIITLSA